MKDRPSYLVPVQGGLAGGGHAPDDAVVADLVLDAALDLAPAGRCGDDDLLELASLVRSSGVLADRAGADTVPGSTRVTCTVHPLRLAGPTEAVPSRVVRRSRGRRRMAAVATLAASAAVIAVGADLALQAPTGPFGGGPADAGGHLGRSNGLVVLAAPGSSPRARITSVTCLHGHCLAATGAGGLPALATSSDGGATWTLRSVGGSATALSAVHCATPRVCWAVGRDGARGAVEVTTDAGVTWATGTVPAGVAQLTSVSCVGVSACWAVGSGDAGGPAVVTTSDGGATWHLQHVPAVVTSLHSVSCPTVETCWAGGSAGKRAAVVATSDGGARWAPVALPDAGQDPSGSTGAAAVTSVNCVGLPWCWATETANGTTALLAGGNGGWRVTASIPATHVAGALDVAEPGCATACTPSLPSGSAPDRVLTELVGGLDHAVPSSTVTGELACPTAVQCWVVQATSGGFTSEAVDPPAGAPA